MQIIEKMKKKYLREKQLILLCYAFLIHLNFFSLYIYLNTKDGTSFNTTLDFLKVSTVLKQVWLFLCKMT